MGCHCPVVLRSHWPAWGCHRPPSTSQPFQDRSAGGGCILLPGSDGKKSAKKEQLLLLSCWNTGRINNVIFHVESVLNFTKLPSRLSAWQVLFLPLVLLSIPTLRTDAASPMDSAVPFLPAQDTLGTNPLSPPLPSPLLQGTPPRQRVIGANEFGLGQPPPSLGYFYFSGAFQPRVLVASPASTTLTSSDIS